MAIRTRWWRPVMRTIRALSADQVVERAATLEDIRSEVLTPDRLNTIVLAGFAGVALLIAVVGVAGVLAFSVSGRVREFGIRLAIGSQPRELVARVVGEGAAIAAIGITTGIFAGLGLMTLAKGVLSDTQAPGCDCLCGGVGRGAVGVGGGGIVFCFGEAGGESRRDASIAVGVNAAFQGAANVRERRAQRDSWVSGKEAVTEDWKYLKCPPVARVLSCGSLEHRR